MCEPVKERMAEVWWFTLIPGVFAGLWRAV